jgi:LPXTG-motif cell wall-anchored protein
MLWAAASAAASPRSASLADTGASVRELAVFGVLLLLAGSTLLLFRRQDVH